MTHAVVFRRRPAVLAVENGLTDSSCEFPSHPTTLQISQVEFFFNLRNFFQKIASLPDSRSLTALVAQTYFQVAPF